LVHRPLDNVLYRALNADAGKRLLHIINFDQPSLLYGKLIYRKKPKLVLTRPDHQNKNSTNHKLTDLLNWNRIVNIIMSQSIKKYVRLPN